MWQWCDRSTMKVWISTWIVPIQSLIYELLLMHAFQKLFFVQFQLKNYFLIRLWVQTCTRSRTGCQRRRRRMKTDCFKCHQTWAHVFCSNIVYFHPALWSRAFHSMNNVVVNCKNFKWPMLNSQYTKFNIMCQKCQVHVLKAISQKGWPEQIR